MKCPRCEGEPTEILGAISTMPAGIEYIHTYFRCGPCDLIVRDTLKDHFMSDHEIFVEILDPDYAQDRLSDIQACPSPMDKFCRCPVHRRIRAGW